MDGSAKPDKLTLKKFGFLDVNNSLANTVAAIQNAPGPSKSALLKDGITSLVEDVISKENNKLRREFKADLNTVKNDICVKAQLYADKIDSELRGALANLDSMMMQLIQVVCTLTRPLHQSNPSFTIASGSAAPLLITTPVTNSDEPNMKR